MFLIVFDKLYIVFNRCCMVGDGHASHKAPHEPGETQQIPGSSPYKPPDNLRRCYGGLTEKMCTATAPPGTPQSWCG